MLFLLRQNIQQPKVEHDPVLSDPTFTRHVLEMN